MPSDQDGRVHLEPFRHTDSNANDAPPPDYSANYTVADKRANAGASRRGLSKSMNLRQARGPVLAQAICRLLSTLLALVIAGLLARSLAVFNATKDYKVLMSFGLVMPAWPSNYGRALMATYLLLAAAVITLVFGMLMTVVWCLVAVGLALPSLSPMYTYVDSGIEPMEISTGQCLIHRTAFHIVRVVRSSIGGLQAL